jgi:hypothetical protein
VKEFRKTYCKCLGESRVKSIPWRERERLNNEKITRYMAQNFLVFLLMNKKIEDPVKISFSKKSVFLPGTRKKYWGLSYGWCRTIVLYRPSVWIFLHELAHICAPRKAWHDERFAKQLKKLYEYWKEFKNA